jgi:hypothetical protein
MLEELRLNPRAPEARSGDRRRAIDAVTDVGVVDPNLSTGFAERGRRRSTGAPNPIHRTWGGTQKEEVG